MATTTTSTLATLFLLVSGGCESAVIIDSDGSIEVVISTRGQDPDPDGYSLTVDGKQAYVLPSSGSLVLQLGQGNHTVQVGGLAENCSVEGANPRAIAVGPSGTVDVSFTVVCERATTGGFRQSI
jgi:DNA-binding beta-propeller fold protein YncE